MFRMPLYIIQSMNLESDNLLSHYTSFKTCVEHILPTQNIRFSSVSQVNDPRESREKFSGITYKGNRHEHASELMDEYKIARDYYVKIFCLCERDENQKLDFRGRSYALPNMWAYYGGNHTGVSLLFDKNKLINKIPASQLIASNNIVYGSVP